MEANNFTNRLKADGSPKDLCDLDKVYQEYKTVLNNLGAKDRGSFSLNVLCILCRNLEKVPSWASAIDSKDLLTLSIECVRETRGLERSECVKTLACVYHIHRFVTKQNASIPPELILKLSYMPFESAALLHEYGKTYWNIIVDRLLYMEKLKNGRIAIIKLLQKLTEDATKVIQVYDTVQFCTQLLTFLFKKLHNLYNDCPSELNKVYGKLFEVVSSKDLKPFKKLTEKESLEFYGKLNDCVYVIAENSSKMNFQGSVLNTVLRTCISMLGHRPDIVHCFQTFYLNSFCSIVNETNMTLTESIMNSLLISCETTEKVYKNAMKVTYPYVNQFVRLYVEYLVTNSEKNNWKDCFTDAIQIYCLKLILILMKKLNSCEQMLKCENCKLKNGLHDVLRFSFLIKHFISISYAQDIDLTNMLSVYFEVLQEQQSVLQQLGTMGCNNYEKCYKKLQADIHNTAILLHKSQHFEYSIKLFDLYLRNEIVHFKSETELRNVSRAFYNKSICELDFKLHEKALIDAYLSLIFGYPESLKTEKHMSLAMDIKAKVLKAKQEEESVDDLQLMSVIEACKKAIEIDNYGNLKPFFCNLKFSELLKHEFRMYVKLWPSVVPIAGVWNSLYDLTKRTCQWMKAQENYLPLLYEVILETPTAVRTIHSEYYNKIVTELLHTFEGKHATTTDRKILHASLLFLKAEYDLADASAKHGWKATEPNMDPDQAQAIRTVSQEHAATRCAIEAVHLWTSIAKELDTVTTSSLRHALQIAQVFVPQLLHLKRTVHGLQLATVCCRVAQYIDDGATYIRNAGTLLYHAHKHSQDIRDVITTAKRYWPELCATKDGVETALVYLCDTAIFYTKLGEVGTAAKLVQTAQAKCLDAKNKFTDTNLELAIGRLMEAQTELCKDGGLSTLAAVNGTQRHYLSVPNAATKWTTRRHRSLTLKLQMSLTGVQATHISASLVAWRRARCIAGVALCAAAAVGQAELYAAITNTSICEDAQTKIENRLKHILGLQPSNDSQPYSSTIQAKTEHMFTPKQEVETMLDHINFKKNQLSPSLPYLTVPGFVIPEFLNHGRFCNCYACENPFCLILTCLTSGLEASMYYRSKEFQIAENYFEGTLKIFDLVDEKLKVIFEKYSKDFDKYVVDIVKNECENEHRRVQIEILIEAAYFDLSKGNTKNSDEKIVRLHEIIQDAKVDPYLRNKVMNLMTVSAKFRKQIKKPVQTCLEEQFDALKLSPGTILEPPKTPEAKPVKPPKITKVIVKDEELLNTKRRVIKLNLDEASSEENETGNKKRTSKRTQFKIPVPITHKPILESLTPRPSKPDILVTAHKPKLETLIPRHSNPGIVVSDASVFDFATPKPKDVTKTEFFTPAETPDQFFTPMTSLRTYTKKSLRQNIVKKLEGEFLTPNAKENTPLPENRLKITVKTKPKAESGSLKALKVKKLLRATSPGKLDQKVEEKKPTRTTRLRKPVKFSLDNDK